MEQLLLYPVGCTQACHEAARILAARGIPVTDHVTPEATHLLMDVPSFSSPGILKSGRTLRSLLELLPPQIILIGGNLDGQIPDEYQSLDLLKDEGYLYENAALTAACALRVTAGKTAFSLRGTNVLVVGWGRIGKHLARLLQGCGAIVSVLSRSEAHLAEAASFGLRPLHREDLDGAIGNFRILYNTAPGMMIPEAVSAQCRNCLKIELASLPGIAGDDVIPARGLPGIYVPESSGKLIADTLLHRLQEERI